MEFQNPTNLAKKIQDNNAIFEVSEDIYLPSAHNNLLNTVNLIEMNNDHKEPSSKTKYSKISNIKRKELIDAVENQGEKLKDAAVRLNLNYSSAKSIIRVFKKEGRYNKKPAKNRYTNKPNPEVSQDQVNLELQLDNLTPVYSLPFAEDNSPYMKKNLHSEAMILAEPKNLEELRAELLKCQLEKRVQPNDFFESTLIKDQVVSYENEFKGSVSNLDFDLKMQQTHDYSSKDSINLSNVPIPMSDTQNKNLDYPFTYETSPMNQIAQYPSMNMQQPPFLPQNQYYTVIFPNDQIHFPMGSPYNFIPNPNIPQLQGHMPMQQIFILTPVMPSVSHQQTNFSNHPNVPLTTFNQQEVGMTFTEHPNQGNPHPSL